MNIALKDANEISYPINEIIRGVKYTFSMPATEVTLHADFEIVATSDIQHNVEIQSGLDAIWKITSKSTGAVAGKAKEGATVFVTVERLKKGDNVAYGSSIKNITVTKSLGGTVDVNLRSSESGRYGTVSKAVYAFTMPEGNVTVNLVLSMLHWMYTISMAVQEHLRWYIPIRGPRWRL